MAESIGKGAAKEILLNFFAHNLAWKTLGGAQGTSTLPIPPAYSAS